jgi:ABC-type lipoprotein release transport system permease subunit
VILLRIALRNLATHKVKSAIVGGLLVFGTVLLVVGQALLGSLDQSMAQSITGSLSGQLQAYASDAKDKLALFGDMSGGTDIGQITRFGEIRSVLEAQPEVQAVVPMGIDAAMVYGGNILDLKLEALRQAHKTGDATRSRELRAHLRRIVAGSDVFWAGYDADPLAAMEFLENKVAPLALNADMLFFRYIGTDTARFAKGFDRFEIVDGTAIPAGQRGFLFNKLTYEDQVKHKTARRLDKMKDRIADGYRIDSDDDLKNWVKLNKAQYKDVTYQLDDSAAATVRAALQQALGSQDSDLDKLLVAFMAMDDGNFANRYKLFYDVIAPRLMLYSVRIGDTMTIKGFTQSGYPTSVNVKVYGTFRFRSLDKSTLAGAVNVMDLMTYRDLYGYLSADKKQELDTLQKASGVRAIARDEAESALFGEGGDEVVELAGGATAVAAAAEVSAVAMAAAASPSQGNESARSYTRQLADRVYSQAEIDSGVVRNLSILLKPGVDQKAAQRRLQQVCDDAKLGLQVVDWRTASGFIGDFLWVIFSVLATALLIIFIVAVVIMNNSMVMATLERTREIGTMRAIGAQKSLILQMFIAEAAVMAAVFGGLGIAMGAGLVAWLHSKGIPAVNDVLVFLFAGPRLYPVLQPLHVVVALAVVSVVALVSTLYPAWLAMRVTPLQAMQDAE